MINTGENSFFKEIFENLFKEIFDEIIELSNETTNFDNLMFYFKNERRRKFGDFESGIKLFEKVNSVYMRLEEEKRDRNAFKSNLKSSK